MNSASRGEGQVVVNSGSGSDLSEQMMGGEVSVRLYGMVE
jgi:hypothetical protein